MRDTRHGAWRGWAALVLPFVGCTTPVLPPPGPLGAPTLADGTLGHQAYVGGTIGVPSGIDGGWRWQPHPNVAIDMVTQAVPSATGSHGTSRAFQGPYFVASAGIWGTLPLGGHTTRHALALRVGPLLSVGDAYGTADTPALGLDVRLAWTLRWAPWGVFHVTFVHDHLDFLGRPRPLGDPDAYTIHPNADWTHGSLGVDIPAGPVAVVLGFSTGVAHRSTSLIVAGHVGLRLGTPAHLPARATPRRLVGRVPRE